jgi:hypothetical protein
MNLPAGTRWRARSRSERYGEMKEVMMMSPASANSAATSPMRRMFSVRSS